MEAADAWLQRRHIVSIQSKYGEMLEKCGPE